MILSRSSAPSCLDVSTLDIAVNNKLYMTFCGKGRKNSCFIIQRNPLISYCSRDNTNQTKFLYTVRIKNKNDSDNEKNCESNAVERVISPYTIKRRPPNTVSCLCRYILHVEILCMEGA